MAGKLISQAGAGFSNLPVLRQLGVLIGFSCSIALAIWLAMWAKEPGLKPLYTQLNLSDANQITNVLQQQNVPFRVDETSGTILIPGDQIYQMRMKLAASGLPHEGSGGFEVLDKGFGLGTTQFMEDARYRHALEVELARSVASIKNIKDARVHLAIPKASSFIREDAKASASVFVNLYSGHGLTDNQCMAIANLIASSIPGLSSDEVTVVDQDGRLLKEGGGDTQMAIADRHLMYTREIEDAYSERIESLIEPIVGEGNIKARVAAQVDFTKTQQTSESYDPDSKMIRSEQIIDQNSGGSSGTSGVPGSLSNQPPSAGQTTATTANPTGSPSSQEVVRNFELDKTISYVQNIPGQLTRLTVAVLIDTSAMTASSDSTDAKATQALAATKVEEITTLVKDAIGFNAERGDRVNVINTSFVKPESPAALPPEKIWNTPIFQDSLRYGGAGVLVLLILFGVIRPLLKSLSNPSMPLLTPEQASAMLAAGGGDGGVISVGQGGGGRRKVAGNADDPASELANLSTYREQMAAVKNMSVEDPKRVAQVVKSWVDEE